MALGHADYHIVRPWADDEMLYGAMSEYLSSWTQGAGRPELRAVSDRGRGGRQPGTPVARRDDALQHAVRFLPGRERSRTAFARRGRARLVAPPGGDSLRRSGHGRSEPARSRRRRRRQRQERRRYMRRRHRRRGTGGLDGGRLCRVGGARDGAARTGALGRAGGGEPPHQELSRVSPRHQRWAAHGANVRAGVADGCAHRLRPAGGRTRTARRPSGGAPARRQRGVRARRS